MTTNPLTPKRGEVWRVNLDPTVGAEIRKTRPAIVISSNAIGVLPVKLIAPITTWNDSFAGKLWLVPITPDGTNGLVQKSVIDALQIRGVSTTRFVEKVGLVPASILEEVAAAVAVVIETQ